MDTKIYMYLFIELLIVSLIDYRTKKISNLWSILHLILTLVVYFLLPEVYPFTWSVFFIPVVFFVVGFVLFLMKIMGGGDAKYLATFFLLIPHSMQRNSLEILLIVTTVIGFYVLLYRIVKNLNQFIMAIRLQDMKLFRGIWGSKFAFSPVILISWIWIGVQYKILI